MTKKDDIEMPDMDELSRQMEDAMAQAQKAMEEEMQVPMGGLSGMMGVLSGLMGNLPGQMADLGAAMEGFEKDHTANVASLAGDPDWALVADIQVGTKLHVVVKAAFDLTKIEQAWRSTQGAGFESLVSGVVEGSGAVTAHEMESGIMGQILGQLQQGRAVAVVEDIDVLACRIQGAPQNAAKTLQLSPEGNIPLAMSEAGVSFEFAPLLTIRNRWDHAAIPTFTPMAEEIVVPVARFEGEQPFSLSFKPTGQDDEITITLGFEPLT